MNTLLRYDLLRLEVFQINPAVRDAIVVTDSGSNSRYGKEGFPVDLEKVREQLSFSPRILSHVE